MDKKSSIKKQIEQAEDLVSDRPNTAVLHLNMACKSYGLNYDPIEKRYTFTTEEAQREIETVKREIGIE